MAEYRARQTIYISAEGQYIVADQTFHSDAVPGTAWEPIDDDAKKAVAAIEDKPEPKPEPARTNAAKPKADDKA